MIRRSITAIGLLTVVWACDKEIPTEAASPLRPSTTRLASVVGDPESYGIQWNALIPHPGYSANGFSRAAFDGCDNNPFYWPHHTYDDLRPHIGHAIAAGVSWVRVDFDHSIVMNGSELQVADGSQPCNPRHLVNYTIQMADEYDLKVVGVLKHTIPFPDSATWVNYVQKVVSEYTYVKHWQIYNEINHTGAFNGVDPQSAYEAYAKGEIYGRLLKWADVPITANGGNVIAGGIVWPYPNGPVYEPPFFLNGMMATAGGKMDILSIHSYRDNSSGIIGDVNQALSWLASNAPGKPLWLTEFGDPFPTDSNDLTLGASILSDVLLAMQQKQAQGYPWAKTFTFHQYGWNLFEPPYYKYVALIKPTAGVFRRNHPDPANNSPLYAYSGAQPTLLYTAYRNAALYGCPVSGCAPFSVSIIGPSSIGAYQGCSWSASVSGGTAPFSYQWSDGSSIISYDSYANYTNNGYSFALYLTVTDNNGQVRSAQHGVYVDGSYCL